MEDDAKWNKPLVRSGFKKQFLFREKDKLIDTKRVQTYV